MLHRPEAPTRAKFPKEPYPLLSVLAIGALGLAVLWFVALPLIGIRALFGSHPYALVALTVLGGAHLIFGYLIQSLPDARVGAMALGPALLVMAVAALGWWKWSVGRRVDSQASDDRR